MLFARSVASSVWAWLKLPAGASLPRSTGEGSCGALDSSKAIETPYCRCADSGGCSVFIAGRPGSNYDGSRELGRFSAVAF